MQNSKECRAIKNLKKKKSTKKNKSKGKLMTTMEIKYSQGSQGEKLFKVENYWSRKIFLFFSRFYTSNIYRTIKGGFVDPI